MENYSLLIIIACSMLFACNKKNTIENPVKEENQKEVNVRFSLGGELTIAEEPLMYSASQTYPRSIAANDLLAIQVASRPKSASGDLKTSAYGIFDNIANLSIKLSTDSIYMFEATLIKDGKTKILNTAGSFGFPLVTTGRGNFSQAVTSAFVYSDTESLTYIREGMTQLSAHGNTTFDLPNTDRYYGFVAHQPTGSEPFTIPMSRAAFAAKFVAPNLKSGRLRISIEGAPDQYIETTTVNKTIQDIYSFKCVSCATFDPHSQKVRVEVRWLKADGSNVVLATQDVTFKRKTLTTININVPDENGKAQGNLSIENSDLIIGETINF